MNGLHFEGYSSARTHPNTHAMNENKSAEANLTFAVKSPADGDLEAMKSLCQAVLKSTNARIATIQELLVDMPDFIHVRWVFA